MPPAERLAARERDALRGFRHAERIALRLVSSRARIAPVIFALVVRVLADASDAFGNTAQEVAARDRRERQSREEASLRDCASRILELIAGSPALCFAFRAAGLQVVDELADFVIEFGKLTCQIGLRALIIFDRALLLRLGLQFVFEPLENSIPERAVARLWYDVTL